MSRIVRKALTISIHIAKGLARASATLVNSRQTPRGYVGSGRIKFGSTTYHVSIGIEDTGTAVRGLATFTVIGTGSLRGRQSEASLRRVANDTLEVNAIWSEIPLPGTTAIAAIYLTAERNSRDSRPGGARAPASPSRTKGREANEPKSLRAFLIRGGNAPQAAPQTRITKSTVVISGGGTASGRKKTPCESQGWPTCCSKVEEGHITLPE